MIRDKRLLISEKAGPKNRLSISKIRPSLDGINKHYIRRVDTMIPNRTVGAGLRAPLEISDGTRSSDTKRRFLTGRACPGQPHRVAPAFFLGLLIALCLCCRAKEQQAEKEAESSATAETKEVETSTVSSVEPVKAPPGLPNVVAKIGDYVITKEELETRLMMELRPKPYEYRSDAEPPNAKTLLLEMIAEKAMIIEARKENYLEDEAIQASLTRFKEEILVNSLVKTHLQGKITVTDSEIDEKIKAEPKLDAERAKAMLTRAKANRLFSQYYNDLCKKFHFQKVSDNFPKAGQIHQRLLFRPQKPRKFGFIRISQVKDELTPEEKNIVLATYDYGKVTLKEWFDALFEFSPPSRPKDLNTLMGVERLLDRASRTPVLVSEAKLLGLDKDENFLKQVKESEDRILLNKIRSEKLKDIKGPIAEEEIIAYFNKNKEAFGTQNTLKIDPIWCQELKTARKAKAELNNGRDFESVRQTYSFEKKSDPFNTSPGSEGMFFKELWKGEPNEIVGPIRGFFHSDGVKWRIVKILEKKPGEVKEYSSDMKNNIEAKMLNKRRNEALSEYRKEILEKYSYEIYDERIRDIDPLDIP